MTASALDEATLAAWRAEAAADRNPFVDPRLIRDAEQLMHLATDEWLSRVLGRPALVPAWHFLSNAELSVAVRAIRADRAHLEAAREAQRAEWRRADEERQQAEAAAAQARRDAWEALRARFPVPVTVGHNWTARHLDPYLTSRGYREVAKPDGTTVRHHAGDVLGHMPVELTRADAETWMRKCAKENGVDSWTDWDALYKTLAKRMHPDLPGGNTDLWERLDAAAALLGVRENKNA